MSARRKMSTAKEQIIRSSPRKSMIDREVKSDPGIKQKSGNKSNTSTESLPEATPRTLLENVIQGHDTVQTTTRKRPRIEQSPQKQPLPKVQRFSPARQVVVSPRNIAPSSSGARSSPNRSMRARSSLRKRATMKNFFAKDNVQGPTPRTMIEGFMQQAPEETPIHGAELQKSEDKIVKISPLVGENARTSGSFNLSKDSFLADYPSFRTRDWSPRVQKASLRDRANALRAQRLASSDDESTNSTKKSTDRRNKTLPDTAQESDSEAESPGTDHNDRKSSSSDEDPGSITFEILSQPPTGSSKSSDSPVLQDKQSASHGRDKVVNVSARVDLDIDKGEEHDDKELDEEREDSEHHDEGDAVEGEHYDGEDDGPSNEPTSQEGTHIGHESRIAQANQSILPEEESTKLYHSVDDITPVKTPKLTQLKITDVLHSPNPLRLLNALENRNMNTSLQQMTRPSQETSNPDTTHRKPGAQRGSRKKPPPKDNSKAPQLPRVLTKSIFQHFSRNRVGKEVLEEVEKVAAEFWANTTGDLAAYAHHAGRSGVEQRDVEMLMIRQGFIQPHQSLNSLIEKYLSLEYREQLIPIARSGNVVKPKI